MTLVGCGKAVAPQTLLLSWLVLFGVPRFASADDFWKRKPAAQWTSAEALRLLRHSPWAKTEVVVFLRGGDQAAYSVVTGTRHCDTDANLNGTCMQRGRIEPPVDSSRQADAAPQLTPSTAFLVRWESAGPVLQAFARLQDLGEREAAAYQAPASRHPADRYVVTVKLENPGIQGFDPFAATPTDKPKLLATLKTRAGVVSPIEVEFTGVGATSAVHFFFPRTIDEAPLLGSGRNAIEFTLIGAGFSVRSKLLVDPGDD